MSCSNLDDLEDIAANLFEFGENDVREKVRK
jgi:hypothetical protein